MTEVSDEISPYEWLAQEFDRLAILRKMWTAHEVAAIIRRHDIERGRPSTARPSPTGEKVEAEPVAWRWKGHDGKWVYEEGNQTKRAMREYDGIVVEDLYPAETVAALEAERNEIALHAAVIDEALTNAIQMRKHAEAERDEARARRDEHFARAQSLIKDVERAKAYTAAMQKNVAEEIGRIRAADKTVEQRRRAEAAESALATANARVKRLEKALEEFAESRNWVVNGRFDPHAGNFDATTFARAALTGDEND